ncbi:hypothetical protein SEUCBS140593_002762 [Sporothrix eucalyptigena]|uniref:FAD-binding FR-type domain-containing protein n=1 Tax=Sporothrix eucalyptigena TaxID=1812306 RepID=A0ABP0B965_9PEZI
MAGIWGLERVIRLAKMATHLVLCRERVTIYPLPGGGVQLFIKTRRAVFCLPASYCYLWVPQVSWYQTHPFTIVSNGPSGVELVIKVCDGFTKDLYESAERNHPAICRASIDGPYGSLPDTTQYDKLVLVAGGSGAAFTFGLMNRILNIDERIKARSIDFVWAVRTTDMLSWFRDHLLNITSRPTVNVTIYVTGSEKPPQVKGSAVDMRDVLPEIPKSDISEAGELESLLGNHSPAPEAMATIEYGKMSTDAVIDKAMQTVSGDDRVLVAGCGPSTLMEALRGSVVRYGAKNECRIDLHCEGYDS